MKLLPERITTVVPPNSGCFCSKNGWCFCAYSLDALWRAAFIPVPQSRDSASGPLRDTPLHWRSLNWEWGSLHHHVSVFPAVFHLSVSPYTEDVHLGLMFLKLNHSVGCVHLVCRWEEVSWEQTLTSFSGRLLVILSGIGGPGKCYCLHSFPRLIMPWGAGFRHTHRYQVRSMWSPSPSHTQMY